MYQALDAVVIRASTRSTPMDLPPWPDPADMATSTESAHRWLATVWACPAVADAVALASPDLAGRVDRMVAGERPRPRELRGVVESVARYLLRMTGRCTPFGLFAGVAPVTLGAAPRVRWGGNHQQVIRADGAWIADVITTLEKCPALLRRLPVVLNTAAEVGDDRVALSCQASAEYDGAQPTELMLADVSVRRTALVDAVVTHARVPIVVGDLLDKLADLPAASRHAAESAVAQLVRLRIVLTALRPPLTAGDRLGHVLAQLTAARADELPETGATVRALRAIAAEMGRPGRAAECRVDRDRLAGRMRTVQPGHDRPVAVDLRLDADITLPPSIVHHARGAATALTRLSPRPLGLPALRDYHAAFLDRYGIGAVVPLAELVDPDVGLGLPATYRGSDRTVAAPPLSDRDRGLLRLAQAATSDGSNEVVLDDAVLDDLAGPGAPTQVPPHIELFVQIHADTVEALRQDRYTLVVTGGSRAAGATTGRFLNLLESHERARFREAYSSVATLRAGAMPVQLSFPPLARSSDHVAGAVPVLPTLLTVGEFVDGEPPIRLADIAVSGDTDGLFFVSLPHQRIIEPTSFNAVEFRHYAHPLARFLNEAPRACAAVYMPFSWGAADSLTALPRVRYGRAVLASARWNLVTADLLPAAMTDASPPRWRAAVDEWRQRFGVPERVQLVEGDSHLPVDLTEPLHLQLLRTVLRRHGRARLDEAPAPDAFGWLDGHAHEIAIPLTSTQAPIARPSFSHGHSVRRDEPHLPGASPWLYAKLYGSAHRTVAILDQVPKLIAECDEAIEWWYLPYRDPEPHLRLRIRLVDADAYGPVAARLGTWAAALRRQGLLGRLQLDTYHPEFGRYGPGKLMAAAERVFVADSAAAIAELKAATAALPLDALDVASLVDLTTAFTGGTAHGMRWLITHIPNRTAAVDRTVRDTALRVADPTGGWATLRDLAGHDAVLRAWDARRAAVTAYRDQLRQHRDPVTVLPSLLHLHNVRLHGIDPDREHRSLQLARAAALRWSAVRTSP